MRPICPECHTPMMSNGTHRSGALSFRCKCGKTATLNSRRPKKDHAKIAKQKAEKLEKERLRRLEILKNDPGGTTREKEIIRAYLSDPKATQASTAKLLEVSRQYLGQLLTRFNAK